ncbi:cupin [Candidatus Saccharibacteria bacterium]|nr:cupin [Candidatus Saccharibacteria bacterium]
METIPQVIQWSHPEPATEELVKQEIRASGLSAMRWTGEPDKHWLGHWHGLQKTLWCAVGEITFHVNGEDILLTPGDKMILPPETVHSADAGPEGVVCYESPPVHENTSTFVETDESVAAPAKD